MLFQGYYLICVVLHVVVKNHLLFIFFLSMAKIMAQNYHKLVCKVERMTHGVDNNFSDWQSDTGKKIDTSKNHIKIVTTHN